MMLELAKTFTLFPTQPAGIQSCSRFWGREEQARMPSRSAAIRSWEHDGKSSGAGGRMRTFRNRERCGSLSCVVLSALQNQRLASPRVHTISFCDDEVFGAGCLFPAPFKEKG